MKKFVWIVFCVTSISFAASWDSLELIVYDGDGKLVFCYTSDPIQEAKEAAQKSDNYIASYKINLERLIDVCQAGANLYGGDSPKGNLANQHIAEARTELELLGNEKLINDIAEDLKQNPLVKSVTVVPSAIETEAIKRYEMGYSYFDSGDYSNAIKEFTKAIEINPNSSEAFYERGNSFRKLKDYKSAIKDYMRAKELGANEAYAYTDCGTSYMHLKDYRSAIENYTKAIELKPDDVDAVYYNRGIAYMSLSAYASAIGDFTRVIELKPNYANAYANRSLSFGLLGDAKSSIRDARKACSLGNCILYQVLKERGYIQNSEETIKITANKKKVIQKKQKPTLAQVAFKNAESELDRWIRSASTTKKKRR